MKRVEKFKNFLLIISLLAISTILCSCGIISVAKESAGLKAYKSGNYEKAVATWNELWNGSISIFSSEDVYRYWCCSDALEKIGKDKKAHEIKLYLWEDYNRNLNKDNKIWVQFEDNHLGELRLLQEFGKEETKRQEAALAKAREERRQLPYRTLRWLEYYGEAGQVYKVKAFAYADTHKNYWIDDGTSERIAGNLVLSHTPPKEFKDLAYYRTPATFYIRYISKNKCSLIDIE